jgi:hypothetical protein
VEVAFLVVNEIDAVVAVVVDAGVRVNETSGRGVLEGVAGFHARCSRVTASTRPLPALCATSRIGGPAESLWAGA